MAKAVKQVFLEQNLEGRLFTASLLLTTPYFIINMISDFFSEITIAEIVVNVSIIIISILMLYFVWKRKFLPEMINIFSFILIATFIYLMTISVGPVGGASYAFPTITILIMLITTGRKKILFSVILLIILVVFTSNLIDFNRAPLYKSLVLDYFLNLIITTILLVFFKMHFDKERKQLTERNDQLKIINQELNKQSEELRTNNEEIQSIRNNLEEIIEERTKQLERENNRMVEYSFINAHLVRAPIANIMGLTNYILEEEQRSDRNLEELNKSVNELDEVIKKISGVLRQ